MLKPFAIEDIGLLDDGRVARAINNDIKMTTCDCLDRPGDASKRKVIIEIEQTPESLHAHVTHDAGFEIEPGDAVQVRIAYADASGREHLGVHPPEIKTLDRELRIFLAHFHIIKIKIFNAKIIKKENEN